jgi:hypothetical protein
VAGLPDYDDTPGREAVATTGTYGRIENSGSDFGSNFRSFGQNVAVPGNTTEVGRDPHNATRATEKAESGTLSGSEKVGRGGIEPPTRRISVCEESTDKALQNSISLEQILASSLTDADIDLEKIILLFRQREGE